MVNRQNSDNKPFSESVVDRQVNDNWLLDICLEHKIV